ncbi:glucosaminidase domain-containing protein [Shewanella maritima]|uniref:glucosaminidase domain-containing protein n=1 Tax=Shewanella maritima TaxID=2520507 RepID=UPI00373513F3
MLSTGRIGKITVALAILILILLAFRAWFIPFISVDDSQRQPIVENELEQVDTSPDFISISDVTEKKRQFFNYFRPMIKKENALITAERNLLKSMISHIEQGSELTDAESYQLAKITTRYKFKLSQPVTIQQLDDLLIRVDTIPAELVLVQAANESGWGSSRFSQEGNNYFGQWCFSKGCGLVPLSRREGLSHEVAKFDTANDSVIAYMNNLNTNSAYTMLRAIRADKRAQQLDARAEELVYGLINYSERKEAYIEELLQMLRHNRKLLKENTKDV